MGHWYRSLALAQAALDRGHIVFIASNRQPPKQFRYLPAEYLNPAHYAGALQAAKPDWVVVDLPHTPPDWIRQLTSCKIVTLNGIGYNQLDGADLRVIQGATAVKLPGPQDKVPVLKGLEYIILRPEIANYKPVPREDYSLCWGGGMDVMRLNQAIADWFPDEKIHFLVADMTPVPTLTSPSHKLLRLDPESTDLFWWLSLAKRLITAMGMIVPESVALNCPVYCLNSSLLHLAFSSAMADRGLIKNFPAVGLPAREEMERFLREPFEPAENKLIDEYGASRVIKEIEKR